MYERIRKEIERRLQGFRSVREFTIKDEYANKVVCEQLSELLSFLDTLEESERPEPYNPVYDEAYLNEKIAKATKSWKDVDTDSMLAECRGYEIVDLDDLLDNYFEKLKVPEHQIVFEDTYRKIATDFYNYGRGHSEIPNNHECLDEAAKKYEEWAESYDTGDYPTYLSARDAFKAGAEWAFGQGLVYEGEVRHHGESGDTVYVEHPSTLRKKYAKMFKTGDKVIVIIRKK